MKFKLTFLSVIILIFFGYILYPRLEVVYIKLFKKSTVIGYRDLNNKLQGDVLLYSKGVLIKKANFVDGKKEGLALTYYDDGTVETKGFYKNDIENGPFIKNYKNGVLNSKGFFKNSKYYGSFYWYRPDQTLDSYAAFNIKGESFFLIEYNKKGQRVNISGYPVSLDFYSVAGDSVITLKPDSTNNITNLYMAIATPPGLRNYITVKIDSKNYRCFVTNKNTVIIPNAFPANGKYNIIIGTKLIDDKNQIVVKNNVKFFIVRK